MNRKNKTPFLLSAITACVMFAVAAAATGIRSASGEAPEAPRTISVTGQCSRTVQSDRASVKVDIDEDGLNRVFIAGLNIVKRSVEKAIDIMESAPRTTVSSNVAINYEATASSGERKSGDIEIPLSFSVPEIDTDNFDPADFLDDILGDLPAFDEVIRTDARYSVNRERLQAEYRKCAEEAFDDARAKAEAEAAELGLRLKDGVVALEQAESRILEDSDVERGAVKIGVKLDVVFGVK